MGNKVIKTLSPAYSILSEGRIYFLVFDSRFSFCLFSICSYSQRRFDFVQRCGNWR